MDTSGYLQDASEYLCIIGELVKNHKYSMCTYGYLEGLGRPGNPPIQTHPETWSTVD